MPKLKAYAVTDKNECLFSTVVFAESRGKARMIAQHTNACEDVDFIDIRAVRVPKLDDAYRGFEEMDWCNAEDRIRMVRDADFVCSYEVNVSEEKCRECPAFMYCGRCEDWRDE